MEIGAASIGVRGLSVIDPLYCVGASDTKSPVGSARTRAEIAKVSRLSQQRAEYQNVYFCGRSFHCFYRLNHNALIGQRKMFLDCLCY